MFQDSSDQTLRLALESWRAGNGPYIIRVGLSSVTTVGRHCFRQLEMILSGDVSQCCHLEEVDAIEFWIQFAKELQSNGNKPEGLIFFLLLFILRHSLAVTQMASLAQTRPWSSCLGLLSAKVISKCHYTLPWFSICNIQEKEIIRHRIKSGCFHDSVTVGM